MLHEQLCGSKLKIRKLCGVKDGPSQKRCDEMHAWESLTNDPGLILPAQIAVASLVPVLRACVETIPNYDKRARILYTSWKNGETYDEFRYLKALHRPGSELVVAAEKSTCQG